MNEVQELMSNAIMQTEFEFHYDAGHGWLKVSINDIKTLGIKDKISYCSYVNGRWAYLEEDCDAGIFIEAYKKFCVDKGLASEVQIRFNEISDGDDSPIRYYDCYDKENI